MSVSGSCLGSCLGSCPGSCLVRVWFVSGFVSGSPGSYLVRVRFVFGEMFGLVFGSRLSSYLVSVGIRVYLIMKAHINNLSFLLR